MDHATKNLLEVLFAGMQAVAVLITGIWVLRRYRIERPHRPRIEFTVACRFWKVTPEAFLASLTITASNKGNVEHRFKSIGFTIKGLKAGAPLTNAEGGPFVQFEKAFCAIENTVPIVEEYYFVRPGVTQPFNYAIQIPAQYEYIKVNAKFAYEDAEDFHYAQGIFKVKETTDQP